MRQYLIGLAAAAAVVVASAPATASCGGCGLGFGFTGFPSYSSGYSSCYNPCGGGYAGGWGGYNYGGGYAYATLPEPVQYYSAQPQYYHVNQGPTYTGPGAFAPVAGYQERAVAGFDGYGVGYYGYGGGPYANPTSHMYHGAAQVATPTVYSYRRAYRPYYRPAVHYGYRARTWATPRVMYAPRPGYRYNHRQYAAPRHFGPRVLRRYY